MLIHPQHAVHIALFGLEHDATVVDTNPNRTHSGIRGIIDLFVVDASRRRVLPEVRHEPHHGLLTLSRNRRERTQKIVR